MTERPAPTVSLIIPAYNVAPYVGAFLDSLAKQSVPLSEFELIFVDDGSPDESGAIITKWADRFAPGAQIITKANGGVSSARNAGLEVARGDWVTFCDPDDVLAPDYIATMIRFARSKAARGVALVTGNILILDDVTGEITDRHPLRFKFASGEQVVDIERHPRFIHLQCTSALYRRGVIERHGIRFDARVRPNFEDAHFTALYLARSDRPRIAVLPDAQYFYRKRTDRTSLLQTSWSRAEKYVDLPQYGYLGLLKAVKDMLGRVPLWTQNLVLYDLFAYFREDKRVHAATGGASTELMLQFHRSLDQMMPYLDAESIDGFDVIPTPLEMRRAMLLGAKKQRPWPVEITVDKLDQDKHIARIRYCYAGDLPVEEFRARGSRVLPVYSKTRAVRYLGKTMMSERTAWLPADGTLAVSLDGRRVPIRVGPPRGNMYTLKPVSLWKSLAGRAGPVAASAPSAGRRVRLALSERFGRRPPRVREGPRRQRLADAVTRTLARSAFCRRRYRQAWLLIDRDSMAQDNAEHLYRYIRAEHPDVNAWFVLARDSPDWDRLRRAGFRLIAHRSRQHSVALLNCEHLISSQVDHYVTHPLDVARFGKGAWRFTFLRNGVGKDDLSRRLNGRPIDLMITTTVDEYESIVADGTPYDLSAKEVRLTGLPRHDRLLRCARRTVPKDQRLILVMPTWRRALVGAPTAGGSDCAKLTDFWRSEYAMQWQAFMASERLRSLTKKTGWRIAFVPHPNMQDYLVDNPLPDHILAYRYRDIDVQEIIARGAVMITDYSSLAFDMAYIRRPVVYFQFDQATFFSGAHTYRRGTWSYEGQGFGPVTLDAEAAVDAVASIVDRQAVPDATYAKRMEDVFPFRDGECCRRAFEAITEIRRPLAGREAYLRLD